MTKFLKILATFVFFLIWGQLQHGCQQGARTSGSGTAYVLMNIFGLILLGAGIYGIWKYNPNNNGDSDNQQLDKS
jgi:hypothetical protein